MTDWQLTVDCDHPGRLVRFWGVVLGYVPPDPPGAHPTWRAYYVSIGEPDASFGDGDDGADRLVDPEGRGPSLWFQAVPEAKSGKNRLHLDVYVPAGGRPAGECRDEIDRRAEELTSLGASVLRRAEAVAGSHYFVAMADPEGNEFCVSAR